MSPLAAYIAGWRRHDTGAVLATLAEDCTIIECYGPVYRGRTRVAEWMAAWFGAGGKIVDWQITRIDTFAQIEFAEWVFTCIWQDEEASFEGATVAHLNAGHIAYLREYATTAPLYDWAGTWRT